MTDQEIIERVNAGLEEEFEIPREKLVPDAKIYEELGLDSLDAVDMVVVLEQQFKIKIREDDGIQKIRTLADLYAFILQKVATRPEQ
ncbi:acyl carrier protein [Desulfovibrio aerotolerans]|uniref:Acyl carrier protein n=1 Tax=Solidesulfovibrio aerotolerans TaxID=295255 RepID=A0A7C9NLG9_9BACT|nr:phosphopantetheine-binding protein [Solidesulfovibrio aerotolerans]MYL84796.1 acyl carrier protein [Solidesulfovibrio aerotolerans]